jgi:cytochrome c oxidase subunit 4
MSEHVQEHDHVVPKKLYFLIFAALMGLLFLTVWVAYLPLHGVGIYVAMTIAIVKAVLVLLYFMHVRYSSRLIWVVAGAGFVWLLIMFGLTASDFLSRDWLPVLGK